MEIKGENSFNTDYSDSGLYRRLGETHPSEMADYLQGVFKIVQHGNPNEVARRINEMLAYVYNKEAGETEIVNHTILNYAVYNFIPLIKTPEEIEGTEDLKSFLNDIPKQFEDDGIIKERCMAGLTQIVFPGSKFVDEDQL